MDPVLLDRPAERSAQLLIRVRDDAVEDRVFRVEAGGTEITRKRTAVAIGPAFRNGVDLHTGRTSLRGVEAAADHLEFCDRIAAEVRAAHADHAPVGRHLLAIQIDLESARLIAI